MTSLSGRSSSSARFPRPHQLLSVFFRRKDSSSASVAELYERGLLQIAKVCESAAHGNLEPRVAGLDSIVAHSDAQAAALARLNALGTAINRMLDITDSYVRESQRSLEAARDGRFHRRFLKRGLLGTFAKGAGIIDAASLAMKREAEALSERQKLSSSFELEVRDLIDRVAASASQANAASRILADNAHIASEAASRAADSSKQMDSEVDSIAKSSSIVVQTAESIAEQTVLSLKSSSDAQRVADDTSAATKQLEDQIQAIGSVINIIRDVAFQTNILSLNAAVEAARAGEAGRGFAVVAEEVRSLAGRTAEATKIVEERISSLQTCTHSVISRIVNIKDDISSCSEVASGIATAASEQNAITAGFQRSLQSIASGTASAKSAMEESHRAAEETSNAASEVFSASTDLERTAIELDRALSAFLNALHHGSTRSSVANSTTSSTTLSIPTFEAKPVSATLRLNNRVFTASRG